MESPATGSALLELRAVSVAYGRLRALDAVSFGVQRGEIVGIIGPNGAGKSTLVDVVAGRTRPVRGDVRLDGVALHGLPPFRIARLGIARTFQIGQPFGDASVLDSVVVGALAGTRDLRTARSLALEMLDRVELGGRADEPAERLDVAQRKRLQLAQALAMRPRLLLLDEIMAGLPPGEVDAFVALVNRVHASGVTIVVVEHVMRAIAALARRIVVLHHGEKIADDASDAVFRDPGVMRAYLGARFQASFEAR